MPVEDDGLGPRVRVTGHDAPAPDAAIAPPVGKMHCECIVSKGAVSVSKPQASQHPAEIGWYEPFRQQARYHEQYRRWFFARDFRFADPENVFRGALIALLYDNLPRKTDPPPPGKEEAYVMKSFQCAVWDLHRKEFGRERPPKWIRDLGDEAISIYWSVKEGVPVSELLTGSTLPPEAIRRMVTTIKARPLAPIRPLLETLEYPDTGSYRTEVEWGTEAALDPVGERAEAEEVACIVGFAIAPVTMLPGYTARLGRNARALAVRLREELALDAMDRALVRHCLAERTQSLGDIPALFCRPSRQVRRRRDELKRLLPRVLADYGLSDAALRDPDIADCLHPSGPGAL